MTIANLSRNDDMFRVDTITTIAILVMQTTMHYVLEIKDENREEDKVIVSFVLFEIFIVTE